MAASVDEEWISGKTLAHGNVQYSQSVCNGTPFFGLRLEALDPPSSSMKDKKKSSVETPEEEEEGGEKVGKDYPQLSPDERATVVILLDVSGSMRDDLPGIRSAIRTLLESVVNKYNVSKLHTHPSDITAFSPAEFERLVCWCMDLTIMTFSDEAFIVYDSTSERKVTPVLEVVDNLYIQNSTNLTVGVELACRVIDRTPDRNVSFIIITDGDPVIGRHRTPAQVALLAKTIPAKAKPIVLGLGHGYKPETLLALGEGKFTFLQENNFESWRMTFNKLADIVCSSVFNVRVELVGLPKSLLKRYGRAQVIGQKSGLIGSMKSREVRWWCFSLRGHDETRTVAEIQEHQRAAPLYFYVQWESRSGKEYSRSVPIKFPSLDFLVPLTDELSEMWIKQMPGKHRPALVTDEIMIAYYNQEASSIVAQLMQLRTDPEKLKEFVDMTKKRTALWTHDNAMDARNTVEEALQSVDDHHRLASIASSASSGHNLHSHVIVDDSAHRFSSAATYFPPDSVTQIHVISTDSMCPSLVPFRRS